MKKRFIVGITSTIIILLILGFPYIKAEILTTRHGEEFLGLEQQTNMLEEAKYHKVISYSKDTAEVFYVTKNSGNLIEFSLKDGKWELDEWKTIWSKSGSASGFMWPYYK